MEPRCELVSSPLEHARGQPGSWADGRSASWRGTTLLPAHARNLLRYVFGTIRPEVIQLVGTLRSVWCRLQNLHEAWTTTPAGIPRLRRTGGVDLRTHWLRAWQVMVPDVFTSACCR